MLLDGSGWFQLLFFFFFFSLSCPSPAPSRSSASRLKRFSSPASESSEYCAALASLGHVRVSTGTLASQR